MPMGFLVSLPFSTSFSTPENTVMHPVSEGKEKGIRSLDQG